MASLLDFETLAVDDIDVRQRDLVEDGERCVVSYAAAIQGVETKRISYKDLRRVCVHLGVRYYKNRNKETMTELIAQKKINGRVPDSYRLPTKRELQNEMTFIIETKKQRREDTNNTEIPGSPVQSATPVYREPSSPVTCGSTTDPATYETGSPVQEARLVQEQPDSPPPTSFILATSHSDNRADLSHLVNPMSSTTAMTAVDAEPEQEGHKSASEDGDNSDSEREIMTLKERADAFNLVHHVREQIEKLEHDVAVHAINRRPGNSYVVKKQRLNEDLDFYLAERRSLMRHLERTRFR